MKKSCSAPASGLEMTTNHELMAKRGIIAVHEPQAGVNYFLQRDQIQIDFRFLKSTVQSSHDYTK